MAKESLTVRQVIEKDYKEEHNADQVMREVAATLARFEGKQVNKRLATALESTLCCAVSYEKAGHGPFVYATIRLWGDGVGVAYDQRYNININSECMLEFSIDKFKEDNARFYRALQVRQDKRQAYLDTKYPEEVEIMLDQLVQAQEAVEEKLQGSFENPCYYSIQRAFGLID